MKRAVRMLLPAILAAGVIAVAAAAPQNAAPLRVCADPNNLPFSNRALQGFENRLADLVARDLGTTVEYTWWPQRRNFIRDTLDARRCDVVMGLLADDAGVGTTRPYYRSTYVFVTRKDAGLSVRSFDDPALRTLRIGVQLIGDDDSSPPAYSLSRRGIVRNMVGYSVYGEGRGDALMAAVAERQVDIAAAWGPQAGYFAARQPVPLMLAPVSPQVDAGFLPQTFEISMAVRRGDVARQRRLSQFIASHRSQIRKLLADYHIPVVGGPP
jgi:mxaJ protein